MARSTLTAMLKPPVGRPKKYAHVRPAPRHAELAISYAPGAQSRHTGLVSRWTKANAGYIPFVGLWIGGGVGGWISYLLGLPDWVLAVPGLVGGYFLSRTILRRIYAPDPADSN